MFSRKKKHIRKEGIMPTFDLFLAQLCEFCAQAGLYEIYDSYTSFRGGLRQELETEKGFKRIASLLKDLYINTDDPDICDAARSLHFQLQCLYCAK